MNDGATWKAGAPGRWLVIGLGVTPVYIRAEHVTSVAHDPQGSVITTINGEKFGTKSAPAMVMKSLGLDVAETKETK